ncbi:MAG TPA: MBL fold metallo-hydrolase [Prolixibacteraceae bacterium]|nr:MBL fold metallo-hydrolase [Prolixibacteraceae bacterium]
MKIKENIHLLKIDFNIQLSPEKVLPRFVNVLLIFGEKITLVDTGVKGSEEKIFSYIAENGRSYSEIETVILSHSHPDHIGSAARIKELTGCKILAHPAEKTWIEEIAVQEKERPVPGFSNLVDRSVTIDEFIENGQILDFGNNQTAKIIHAPGHSAGSVNLYFRNEKVLFTADSIPLKSDIPNYDNAHQLLVSLHVIEKNSDYEILLSSWTPAFSDAHEIKKLLAEGRSWIEMIDKAVKANYKGTETEYLEFCRATVHQLGLPPFLVNPIVDRSFRSHL